MEKEKGEIKELAGGWITERKGTEVPLFLKLTYVGFSLFGVIYLILYRSGEETNAARGALVRELNKATVAPPAPWIALLGACLILFVGGLLFFAFFGRTEED